MKSIPRVRHTFAKNIIRHSIPNVINNTDRNITEQEQH